MPTYVKRPNHPYADEDGFVEKSLLYVEGSDAPYVISDTMDATRHMATNRMHTSKAAFRADTKASGCIEIGTETKHVLTPKPVVMDRSKRRDDIRRTIYELRNGTRR